MREDQAKRGNYDGAGSLGKRKEVEPHWGHLGRIQKRNAKTLLG